MQPRDSLTFLQVRTVRRDVWIVHSSHSPYIFHTVATIQYLFMFHFASRRDQPYYLFWNTCIGVHCLPLFAMLDRGYYFRFCRDCVAWVRLICATLGIIFGKYVYCLKEGISNQQMPFYFVVREIHAQRFSVIEGQWNCLAQIVVLPLSKTVHAALMNVVCVCVRALEQSVQCSRCFYTN